MKEKRWESVEKMKMIGLVAYGFCVKDSRNQRLELHNVLGRNVIDAIGESIALANNAYSDDRASERVFCFDQNESETFANNDGQERYSALFARVKTGEYGIQSEIVDSRTGVVSHRRTETEADVMPFGFALCVPAGECDNGILILQTIGNYGIKLALNRKLNDMIKSIDPELRFEMGIVVPKLVLNRFFEQGVLKALRFIQYEIPAEEAERFGLNHNTNETSKEVIIRKPVGFLRNKARELNEWRNGAITYGDVVQIEGFDYDELKMDFKLGKTSKTISLRNIDNLQMTEDVTEDVILEGGHPTFNSLKEVMRDTGKDYLIAKGLIVE